MVILLESDNLDDLVAAQDCRVIGIELWDEFRDRTKGGRWQDMHKQPYDIMEMYFER